jgi:hypothetical protein
MITRISEVQNPISLINNSFNSIDNGIKGPVDLSPETTISKQMSNEAAGISKYMSDDKQRHVDPSVHILTS